MCIHYLVGYGTQLIWRLHDKLAQLGQDHDNLELLNTLYVLYHPFTIFITSLLHLGRKQTLHLPLYCAAIIFGYCHIHLTRRGKMSGRSKCDITSFFVKRGKIAGKSSKFFCRLKARPIHFKLCCYNNIFQVLKIYVIQQKSD